MQSYVPLAARVTATTDTGRMRTMGITLGRVMRIIPMLTRITMSLRLVTTHHLLCRCSVAWANWATTMA
jgi:hypothetical protein